jgi:hypothetical protein
MDGEISASWPLQLSSIWLALAGGFVPALIVAFKRRKVTSWYLYGFACTLVAWPLLALPTIDALLIGRNKRSKRGAQRQRRADALALLAESGVRSYPSWVADLRRKSTAMIDRRRYAYEHIGRGDALELVREPANRNNDHAVAYRHRGVHLGYVPKRQPWIADALDDGLSLAAIVEQIKIGGIFRRRAKFVGTRIIVLNGSL